MGYTHYWRSQRPLTTEETTRILDAARKIVDGCGVPLAGPHGEGKILWNETMVKLNGVGDNSHESFIFPTSSDFEFCKTALKPYDKVVTAILVTTATIAPGAYKISSDGDPEDWAKGVDLALLCVGDLYPNISVKTLGWDNDEF